MSIQGFGRFGRFAEVREVREVREVPEVPKEREALAERSSVQNCTLIVKDCADSAQEGSGM